MNLDDVLQMKTSDLDKLIRKSFSINLQKILDHRGISMNELAKQVEISGPSIWGYKTDNTFPSTATLLKISIFLEVNINDLLLPEELNTYINSSRKNSENIDSKIDKIILMLSKILEENF